MDWTTRRLRFDPRQGQRIFTLASVSRPVLGPTQPPVQWVPGVLSPGVKRGRGVTLTTHPHLVPRSIMSRNYLALSTSAFLACSGTILVLSNTLRNGRAMVQVVSRRPLTAEARVRARFNPCGICGGQIGRGGYYKGREKLTASQEKAVLSGC
jgi:hypothetical protein